MNALEKTFVALDKMNKDEVFSFINNGGNKIGALKVGMELFYLEGRELLFELKKIFRGEIFLDLKLHDIPQTVAGAIKSLNGLPIDFLTIHIPGGEEMCKAALKARDQYLPGVKILGVTCLTSLDETDITGITGSPSLVDFTSRLMKNALKFQIDGIILSPKELELINSIDTGKKLLKVCPGIRFKEDSNDDQKRVTTPDFAFNQGASYLVMGRSLTQTDKLNEKIQYLSSLVLA